MTRSAQPWYETEPWQQQGTTIYVREGQTPQDVIGTISNPGNCMRAIACKNTLEGISHEALPAIKRMLDELLSAPVEVTAHDPSKQRLADVIQMWLNRIK